MLPFLSVYGTAWPFPLSNILQPVQMTVHSVAHYLFPEDYFNTTFISSWFQLWVFNIHFRIIFKCISYKYYEKCKSTAVYYLFYYSILCSGYLHWLNSYIISVLIPLYCKHHPFYIIYSTLSCHPHSKYDAIKLQLVFFGLHRLCVFHGFTQRLLGFQMTVRVCLHIYVVEKCCGL